jgi:hypothetical protein
MAGRTIDTWTDLENALDPFIPRALARQIRDWYERTPELGPEAAIKILVACLDIRGQVRIENAVGVTREGLLERLQRDSGNVVAFAPRGGQDGR